MIIQLRLNADTDVDAFQPMIDVAIGSDQFDLYIGEGRFESGHKWRQNVPTKRGCGSDTQWSLRFGFIGRSLQGEFYPAGRIDRSGALRPEERACDLKTKLQIIISHVMGATLNDQSVLD